MTQTPPIKHATVAAVLAAVCLLCALAAPASAGEVEDRIAKRLADAVPQFQVESVRPTETDALYEVRSRAGEIIYTTADGQYLLTGDLLKITDSGIANVSEQARADQRKQLLDDYGTDAAITFPANGEQKAEISVFTDIDCPYCRKLHHEIKQINDYGITVHYYAFPRSGPDTPSFFKYVSVWCADDSRAAMTRAKDGKDVPSATCENPVRAQYELGGKVGVTGTPAIILEDGNMIRGYVPAKTLARGLGLL